MIEILGILIGFGSIMLMFSILVTSIVQAISSALSLRAWNLHRGLRSLANKIGSLNNNGAPNEQLADRLLTLT
jgi:hypothetical protein